MPHPHPPFVTHAVGTVWHQPTGSFSTRASPQRIVPIRALPCPTLWLLAVCGAVSLQTNGYTPLLIASLKGHVACVEALLGVGASVDRTNVSVAVGRE